jgi:hypothetical protein
VLEDRFGEDDRLRQIVIPGELHLLGIDLANAPWIVTADLRAGPRLDGQAKLVSDGQAEECSAVAVEGEGHGPEILPDPPAG